MVRERVQTLILLEPVFCSRLFLAGEACALPELAQNAAPCFTEVPAWVFPACFT